ncbi:MAG TPA: glycosyltransferase [Candidatus Omnitrophota bacterium]|nr:glycosyltransferase [Candidatus Omnitrophota bacterium]
MYDFPFVSIIAPVYNGEKTVSVLLSSLLEQDYPKDKLEILIVDNNSRDLSRQIIAGFPVKLLDETMVQSSYAARNRGIRSAQGEIFAFIDSDCRANPDWVKKGVNALLNEGADLAGGKVEFIFSNRPQLQRYMIRSLILMLRRA